MSHIHVMLEAVEPKRNVNRSYTLSLTKGLFNSWVVMVGYGRYNHKGHQKNYPFVSLGDAKSFIRKTLRKRLTAEKRIGCNYHIVHRKSSDDFGDWI